MKKQIENFQTNKTISSGVIFIHTTSETAEILLIKNKKSGTWGFPKGHVEDNESLIDAAIREVYEEVGIKITYLEKEPFFESNYIDDKGNTKKVIYFVKKIDKIVPELNDEIDDYMWIDLRGAYEILIFPELKEIIKKIKSLIHEKNEFQK